MGLGLAERSELSSSTFQIVLILMFVILQDMVGKNAGINQKYNEESASTK